MKNKNIILLTLCIAIVGISLVIGQKVGSLSGIDSQIEEMVREVNGDYKPWIKSFWTPPSGEIETMLFSLQAAMGAGFIGYYIGRKRNVQDNKSLCKKE